MVDARPRLGYRGRLREDDDERDGHLLAMLEEHSVITDLNRKPGHHVHSVPGGVKVEHPNSTICAYCHGLPSKSMHTWPEDPR